MRTFTFKGLFLIAVFMLLGCLSIQAADDDLITKQITIKLDEAGTLPNKIGSSKMYKITNLKIIGEINGTDWKMIRAMAGGSTYYGGSTEGNLSVLDLSEAKIVGGGDYYYHDNGSHYYYIYNNGFMSYSGKSCTENDEIGDFAFYNCSRLTSLTLSSNITKIGTCAFYECSGLKEVKFCINEDLETYLTKGHPYIGVNCGINYYLNDKEVTSIVIPSNVTSLGLCAFQNCIGLTNLTLSSNITEIGGSAFEGCSGLKEVKFCINEDLETYLTKGHPYIGVNCGINYYLNDKEVTSIVIPSNVTSLGDYAFERCTTLQSVFVSWPTPISAGKAFNKADVSKCILYVPQGTESDYFLVDVWGDFGNIIEYNPTGIDKVTTSTEAKELSRYSVNGQRLSAPAKGLNIVKYSDGSVKKVAVQ
uniref:leucine-rich repeat domain-containing protein n=1 Tax=Segatella copri TaxID=165179 RepID=UPI003FEF00D9